MLELTSERGNANITSIGYHFVPIGLAKKKLVRKRTNRILIESHWYNSFLGMALEGHSGEHIKWVFLGLAITPGPENKKSKST